MTDKEEFQPHEKEYPLAGKIVKLSPILQDKYNGIVKDAHVRIYDWFDRAVIGQLGHAESWKEQKGNRTCIEFAMRVKSADGKIPYTDRVLLVHNPDGSPHIIHVAEVGGVID